MGVPDDANPLNRRLPAEVVSRRRPEKKKVPEEEAPLETDRGQVLALKPEQRVKWLSKALQKGQEGKVAITTLYDIISHTKFGQGVSDNQGKKMFKFVRANLSLFSQKQQRFLEGESKLAKDFRSRGHAVEADASEPVAASSATAPEADNDFTGGLTLDESPQLWSRLMTLTPEQCEEAIEALDPVTKSRLEDFLEARMKAKREGSAVAAAAAATAAASARAAESPSRSRRRSKSKSSRSGSSSRSSDGAVKAKKQEPKSKKAKDAEKSKRTRSSSGSSHSSSSSSSRRRKRSRSRHDKKKK